MCGLTNKLKRRLDLEDEVTFKQRHRRIPPAPYEEVCTHLQQLLDYGIIRESNSPCASPVVLVRKKNGKLCFCVDYRLLNQKTIRYSYALLRVDELLDNLIGAQYFSSLDLRSGYYQVELRKNISRGQHLWLDHLVFTSLRGCHLD